jgi:hypothetical protein
MEISNRSSTPADRGRNLRHVGSVRLFVACDAPPGDAILNQRELGQFAQVMLRIARIPVVSSSSNPDAPRLQITLHAIKVGDLYSVHVILELLDRVWLIRGVTQEAIDAPTWRDVGVFVASPSELRGKLRDHMGKLMASFMNDYLAVNGSGVNSSEPKTDLVL